jgi:hypothetical protein
MIITALCNSASPPMISLLQAIQALNVARQIHDCFKRNEDAIPSAAEKRDVIVTTQARLRFSFRFQVF